EDRPGYPLERCPGRLGWKGRAEDGRSFVAPGAHALRGISHNGRSRRLLMSWLEWLITRERIKMGPGCEYSLLNRSGGVISNGGIVYESILVYYSDLGAESASNWFGVTACNNPGKMYAN